MSRLANRRILVVEDEFLIAAALCDMLEDAAATVIGPATNVTEAMRILGEQEVEAAILDVNLNGACSDPIAEELKTRRIPFIFTTGYGVTDLTTRFRAPVVAKPYTFEEIDDQLALALLDRRQG